MDSVSYGILREENLTVSISHGNHHLKIQAKISKRVSHGTS